MKRKQTKNHFVQYQHKKTETKPTENSRKISKKGNVSDDKKAKRCHSEPKDGVSALKNS
jgi:hypothetical protein